MKVNWLHFNWIVFNKRNGFKMTLEDRGIVKRMSVWDTIYVKLYNMAL